MKKRQLLICLMSFLFITTQAQIPSGNIASATKSAFKFLTQNTTGRSKVIKQKISNVQVSKALNVAVAGTLNNLLTSAEKSTITNLIITGNIDARDFRIMRDSMPVLSVLDISSVSIAAYSGTEGTEEYSSNYNANQIPGYSFYSQTETIEKANTTLTSIILPHSVTSFGVLAFAFCKSLISISISAKFLDIGYFPFVGSSAKIIVDSENANYNSIDGVLYDKSQKILIHFPDIDYQNFIVPTSVETISDYAFCFDEKIASVQIPTTVKSIGKYAFTNSTASINVDAENSNYTSQDGVLFNKSKTVLIQSPISLSGSYLIPASVDSIGNNSFYNCTLMTAVSMPSSLSYIADASFYNCSGLMSITVNSLPISISSSSGVFDGVNSNTCILNVPLGAKAAYQSASGWNSFTNIVENTHGLILGTFKLTLSSAAGSNSGVIISTNDAWAAVSDQSWLQVSPQSGSGNDTILVTAEANPTSNNRKAIVTISVNGIQPQTLTVTQAGLPMTINITAGKLSTSLTALELSSIINLKITGTIDARDFKTMRDNMPKLAFLDLSEVNVVAYNGSAGTASWITNYPANRIADYAFSLGMSSQQTNLVMVKLPTSITEVGEYAFYSCEGLTEIIIPNNVIFLGKGAFGSCNNLANVTLPDKLTTIEDQAFTGGAFTSITIPNTVKSIGNDAFSFCKKLRSITIPNSVTTIANTAFQYCGELSDLNIGNSVTTIGNSAFSNCTALTRINIPNSVTLLDGFAFGFCTNLKEVVLPGSLTTIGYGCFQNCTNLTSISIPNSVTKIDYSAFSYCQSLKDVNIPGSVTNIENAAFSNCSSLKTINIPNSVIKIGSYAFSECSSLDSIYVNRDVPLDLSNSQFIFNNVAKNRCILHVPFGTKNQYSTANQWKDFSNITENIHGFALSTDTLELLSNEGSNASVSLKSNEQWVVSSNKTWLKISPENGTGNDTLTITANANVSSLQRAELVTVTSGAISKTIAVVQLASPKTLNITAGSLVNALTVEEMNTITNLTITGTINARDFKIMRDSMPSLKAVNLSTANIVAYTGQLGSAGNYSYTYPVNEIPQNAFFNSTNYKGKTTLKSIVLPVSITSIGNSAFEYCSGLTQIEIPDLVISIGNSTFERCTGLSEIKVSKSIKTISGDAFKNCSALNSISFPNSLKSIADNAFQYCTELTSLIIPDSVSVLNWYTFANCTKLTSVTLGKSLSSLNYAVFKECTSLKEIVMTEALKTIGDNTFANTGLTNLFLPKSVTSIGYSAFANCKELTEVVLPDSLNLIGTAAFSNCSELKRITLGNQLNTIKSEAFYNCINLTNIVIPESVITIEGSAFYNCKGLQSITANPLIPAELSGSSNVFSGIDKTKCILNVPYQAKILYSTANQWRDFVSILENPNGLKLDVYAARLKSNAGSSVDVNVISNTLWSAVSDKSWLTLSSSAGSGNKLITLSADENSSITARIAIVTISANGVPDQTITITQSALAKSLQVTAGNLSASLTQEELNTVSNLILTGTIDARDFKTMRDNMPLLADVDLSGTTIVAYTGNAGTYAYNATYPAATIPQYAFYSYTTSKAKLTLKSIVLPSSSVSIDIFAFQNCSGLFAVSLPETLTSINDFAFRYCTGLGEISFPNSLLTIGQYSFYNCTGIKKLNLGNSLNTINNYAFSTCTALRSVKLPNSLTTIGNYVFENCNSLTDIIFGSSMSTTGVSTFYGCKGIKSIVLPNSIKTVGNSCFDSCTNLEQVIFGNSLTTISSAAFSSCTKLDNVVIPNTVTTLDFRAFMDCYALKNITLSNSLTTIGSDAFSACYGLTDIVIPNSVTTINDAAFSGCSALKNIKFSSKLTTIGRHAFSSCRGLGDVILPNSVTTIGDYAFSTYSGMRSITIPAGVGSLGSSSISSSGLTAIYSMASNPITPGSSSVFSSVNKSTCVLYVPKGSKSIYQSTPQWEDFTNISEEFWFLLENQDIHIKSGVGYTIDMPTDKTFTVESNQTWLRTHVVSDNGSYKIVLASDINPDFSLRTAFITISFPNGPIRIFTVIQSGSAKTVSVSSGNLRTSLTSSELNTVSNLILTGTIDARDFRVMRDSMPQLSDIDLKDATITAYSGSEGTNPSIGSYPANETPINAFYKTYSGVGKETLTNVILPTNITSIGKSSFAYANGLSSIVIPEQVTVIGMTAFARCEGLKEVTIGNSVTTIGVEAFFICTKLTEVTIPNSVTTISAEAFSNCKSLKWVTFPNNLTVLESDAFSFCYSLTSVELPNTITTLGDDVFTFCTSLTKANIPNGLTDLKYGVFYGCAQLKEMTIPLAVKTIGSRVFGKCSALTTISIPADVSKMGYGAFEHCTGLKSIYAYQTTPLDLSASYYATVFNGINKTTCKLYVPTASKALYQAAVEWKDFTTIIEMTTPVSVVKESTIKIYPNPVREFFSITGLSESARFILTDVNGIQIISCRVGVDERIQVGDLPKGMYIARFITSEGTIEQKIIKK